MYEWIKAAHVVAVLIFCGGLIGLLIVSTVIGARGPQEIDMNATLRTAVQKWDRFVTLPALVLVWAFGMWIAIDGGWFVETWLQIKLLFVVILSGLHGILSGRLRRRDLDTPIGRPVLPTFITGLILVSLSSIAVAAVVKPF